MGNQLVDNNDYLDIDIVCQARFTKILNRVAPDERVRDLLSREEITNLRIACWRGFISSVIHTLKDFL